MRRALLLLAVAALLPASACAPPIAIKRDAVAAQRQATRNVLVTGDLSRRTKNLLYDRDLLARYDKDPAGVIASLHAALVAGNLLPQDLVALAEVSYHHAVHGGGSPYYLAAALYAWGYLFPDDPHDGPGRFNPRERVACDVYNRSLTQGLKRARCPATPASPPDRPS